MKELRAQAVIPRRYQMERDPIRFREFVYQDIARKLASALMREGCEITERRDEETGDILIEATVYVLEGGGRMTGARLPVSGFQPIFDGSKLDLESLRLLGTNKMAAGAVEFIRERGKGIDYARGERDRSVKEKAAKSEVEKRTRRDAPSAEERAAALVRVAVRKIQID